MLVRPLKVQIRDPIGRAIGTVAQHERMGRAAVEPHVQDVENLLPGLRVMVVAQEPRLRAILIPAIRTLGPARQSGRASIIE